MRHAILFCSMVACTMLVTGVAGAAVQSADVPVGSDVTVYLGDPAGITGVRVHNAMGTGDPDAFNFRLEIEGLSPDPHDTAVQAGFQLLDNTLMDVRTTPSADGKMQARMRIRYASEARKMGLSRPRKEKLLLMRRARKRDGAMMWMPIREAMRRRGIAVKRPKKGAAEFTLGAWGNDPTDEYVWGVLDAGGNYAVGIPEPLSAGLLAGGAALMMLVRRRRHA